MSGSINDTDIGVTTPAIGNFSSLGIDGAYTFVSTPGSAGQILISNGNGTTSWATPSSGPTDLSGMSVILTNVSPGSLNIGTFSNDIIAFNAVASGVSAWADTSNHRIKPTVAGIYKFEFTTYCDNPRRGSTTFSSLYLNGNFMQQFATNSSTTPVTVMGSAISYMNGSTDYMDLRLTNSFGFSMGQFIYCYDGNHHYLSYLMATKIG